MRFRACSILVTLLVLLSAASSVAAQKKKAAEGADGDAASDAAPDGDAAAEGAPAEEVAEPDAWERPPMEEEKAAPAKPSEPPPPPVAGDGRPFMVGLVVGWGFNTDRNNGGFGADPYGLGLGVMGGYTFDFQLYAGVRYTYFIGTSQSSVGGRPPLPTDSSANYMQISAEAGYDLWAGDVIVRPGLLIGALVGLYESQGAGAATTGSTGDMFFGPGFTVAVPIDSFFLGGDLRGYLATGDGVSGVGLNVVGGARFE